jgi:radical SAM protein with 4Fe4S-binding SPASM domain
MPWNVADVPDLVELAWRLGARAFNLFFLVCTGRGEQVTDLSPAQHEAILVLLNGLQKAYEGRIGIGAKCAPQYQRIAYQADPGSPHLRGFTGGCPAATHYCRISPTGDLTPCPYLPLAVGNLKAQRLSDLWQESFLLKALRDRSRLGGRCGRCEFRGVCSGCRARAFAECGDYHAEDPSCPYEPGQVGTAPIVPDPARTYGLSPTLTLPWSTQALERLERVPTFARGMVVRAAERYAQEHGHAEVTPEVLTGARESLAARVGLPFLGQPGHRQPASRPGTS